MTITLLNKTNVSSESEEELEELGAASPSVSSFLSSLGT